MSIVISSMSERSFRAQSPEDYARERRHRPASSMDVAPQKFVDNKPIKRRGSFNLPISLRSKSKQKKQKQTIQGITQPLEQNTISAAPSSAEEQQRNVKALLRGERENQREKEQEQPRLPQNLGIGSAASIRSCQTDLSSISEDQALGYANQKLTSHLLPIKSAMKGGSGPPSIISEALSEEIGSSCGAHDSHKQKPRVSFSDEQERNQIFNAGIGGKCCFYGRGEGWSFEVSKYDSFEGEECCHHLHQPPRRLKYRLKFRRLSHRCQRRRPLSLFPLLRRTSSLSRNGNHPASIQVNSKRRILYQIDSHQYSHQYNQIPFQITSTIHLK